MQLVGNHTHFMQFKNNNCTHNYKSKLHSNVYDYLYKMQLIYKVSGQLTTKIADKVIIVVKP